MRKEHIKMEMTTKLRKLNGDESDIEKVVQHFKRETLTEEEKKDNKYLYRILAIGNHTETGERMVVYQAMYAPYKTFIRPADMFYSPVDKDKYPNIKQPFRLMEVK